MEITDTISEFASGVNAVQETTALHIVDGWIYVAYTNALQEAVVARRSLVGGYWQSVVVGSVLKDSHNGVSVGVDPLGYIHVCWDIHGAAVLNYKVSTAPHVLDFPNAIMGGTPTSAVSYARFYRAGGAFYFLCREGSSGSGDEWAKVWTPAGFVDLAIPLVVGSALAPPDNPYLGQAAPQANGDLVIVGTSRIGLQNFGVWYVRYVAATGQWVRVNGQPYTLPMSRNTLDTIPDTDTDGTIANNSLSVVLDESGSPHVVYQKEAGGFQEAFHSAWTGNEWVTNQVSNQRSVRLRACPGGPQDGPFRPCDYQMQGPCIVRVGEGFRMFWVRSVSPSPGAWVRPPGILYQADSMTGETWTISEVRRDVRQYSGEMPRETTGAPFVLLQELGESRRLLLWDLSVQPVLPSPQARLSASLPAGGSRHLDLGNGSEWDSPAISISAWIRPNDTGREMTIIDRGGLIADRQFRLLLWGNTVPAPLHYDPTRVEVLLNHATGWGLVWHPEVEVVPGILSHLVFTWDGTIVRFYLNGIEAASKEYVATMQTSSGSVLLGANKSGTGIPERFWEGWIGLEFYDTALSGVQVAALWEAGPQM